MSLKRIGSWGAAWGLVMLAGTLAFAQGMQDMQLFGHDDADQYGGGQRANEGFFFDVTGLVLNIAKSSVATFGHQPAAGVGFPAAYIGPRDEVDTNRVPVFNSLDTSWMESIWAGGQRIEFGNVCEHQGWLVGYTRLHRATQALNTNGVHWNLDHETDRTVNPLLGNVNPLYDGTAQPTPEDPGAVPPVYGDLQEIPIIFDRVRMVQTTSLQSVDALYLFRMHPTERGGVWEWSFGPRWFEFEENFKVFGTGGPLANTLINNHAWNELIGPQIGLRINHAYRGWTFSGMGSFTAAANFQSVRLGGVVGDRLTEANFPDLTARAGIPPGTLVPWRFNSTTVGGAGGSGVFHETEFSPLVEVRLEAKYQMTRAMSFSAGWNAIWVDSIARPSGMIDYRIFPDGNVLAVDPSNNRQSVFVNGLMLGLEFNR